MAHSKPKRGHGFGHARHGVDCKEKPIMYKEGRICAKKGCGTILSCYNPSRFCSPHERENLFGREERYLKNLGRWNWNKKRKDKLFPTLEEQVKILEASPSVTK